MTSGSGYARGACPPGDAVGAAFGKGRRRVPGTWASVGQGGLDRATFDVGIAPDGPCAFREAGSSSARRGQPFGCGRVLVSHRSARGSPPPSGVVAVRPSCSSNGSSSRAPRGGREAIARRAIAISRPWFHPPATGSLWNRLRGQPDRLGEPTTADGVPGAGDANPSRPSDGCGSANVHGGMRRGRRWSGCAVRLGRKSRRRAPPARPPRLDDGSLHSGARALTHGRSQLCAERSRIFAHLQNRRRYGPTCRSLRNPVKLRDGPGGWHPGAGCRSRMATCRPDLAVRRPGRRREVAFASRPRDRTRR